MRPPFPSQINVPVQAERERVCRGGISSYDALVMFAVYPETEAGETASVVDVPHRLCLSPMGVVANGKDFRPMGRPLQPVTDPDRSLRWL